MDEGVAEGIGGKLDFLEYFSARPDPRQSRKVLCPLGEVLFLTLCAVLCGADGWAWSSQQKRVLGARAAAEKSSEIAAIRALPDLLAIRGAIVTIDAMGCQKKIAGKIIAKCADYIFGPKGNQGRLRDDVEFLFSE